LIQFLWQEPFIAHPAQPAPQPDFPAFLSLTIIRIIRNTTRIRIAVTRTVPQFALSHSII